MKPRDKKIDRIPSNQYDPIMFTPLDPSEKLFYFTRPNGCHIGYNVETLVKYILSSGNFMEPETRIDFSDEELKEMDMLVEQAGVKDLGSVYEAKKKKKQLFHEKKLSEESLLGLERCAGQVVFEMLKLVESFAMDEESEHLSSQNTVDPSRQEERVIEAPGDNTYGTIVTGVRNQDNESDYDDEIDDNMNSDENQEEEEEETSYFVERYRQSRRRRIYDDEKAESAQVRLIIELFPAFVNYFKEMTNIDKDYSLQCMKHYRSYLRGPPNHRTIDYSEEGFLQIILEFLDNVLQGQADSFSFGFC